MTQYKISITGIITLMFLTNFAAEPFVLPHFTIRSQGLNTPRHMVGVVQQLFANTDKKIHGTIAGIISYTRSFNDEEITKCLFGTKCTPAITISGSRVTDRNKSDWLADYFYLPTDFKSTLSFKPRIDNILLDMNFFIGLDEWVDGLYFAVYAPIVHSRWNLGLCETVDAKGTNTHTPGYFTPDTMNRNNLLNNFTEYAEGTVINTLTQSVAGSDTTITFRRLNKARMSHSKLNQTRLADFRTMIGYDFIHKDCFVFGLQGLINGPTGNRPEGEYLFEPIIGNGHHWELGTSLKLHAMPWKSEDEEKEIIFSANLSLMHLFSSKQRRTFDLKGKPFSRYMLAERLGTPLNNNLKGNGAVPSAQFQNEFAPIANLSNVSVEVSATIQAELTTMLTFVCDHFSWDIGYNFWARSCENLKLRGPSEFENNTQWALKGDSHIFGFDRGAASSGPLEGAIALSATQNSATINAGKNFTSDRTTTQAILNPGIDNPQNATGDGSGGTADNPLSSDPTTASLSIQTSINPVFISSADIDVCERRSSGMSSKLFTHFSYAWKKRKNWVPYLGIGGEVEFNHNSSNSCEQACDQCISCAISQWGIWIKGGMTF